MNKSSYIIAGVLVVLCLLWLGSGIFSSDDGGSSEALQSEQAQKEDEPFAVEVVTSIAQDFVPDIIITGQSKASRMVDLSSEVAAKVKTIANGKGQKVKEGDLVIELNTDDRQANVKQARERVRQRQIEYDAAINLEKKGFSPRVRSAEMRAELEVAKANLEAAQLELADVNVRAPFSGIVDRQYVEVGDYVNVGEALVKIVDLDPLEFEMFASERDVQNISLGQSAEITINDNTKLQGKVSFVAVSADSETRTFPVEIQIPNEDLSYKEGMTAKIKLPAKETQAHKLPSSVLVLNTEGDIGVRVVDEGNIVSFVALSILQNDGQKIWVTGLGPSATVIVRGQDFVTNGDKVRVSQTSEKSDNLESKIGSDDQSDN